MAWHCTPELNSSLRRAQHFFEKQAAYMPDDPGSEAPIFIENNGSNLNRFLERLASQIHDGRAEGKKIRIGFYGDSNHTRDYASGALRNALGAWFGYGGHGFVAASKPWAWYEHREIAHKVHRWTSNAVSTPEASRPIYGHSGIVGAGKRGSWVEFASTDEGATANQEFSRMVVSYLCGPKGGEFKLMVDGKVNSTIDTRCDKERYASTAVDVPLGRHTVKLKVVSGNVTFFGVVFENENMGVVVDGLGVGALNLADISNMSPEIYKASLKDRNYDLVIFHTGTNMWAPNAHPKWAKTVIERVREALGDDIPILFLSPPDFARRRGHRKVSHVRMEECAAEKRQIARDHKVAFWDFFNASGGLGTISKWHAMGQVNNDLVHYHQGFHEVMGRRLAYALFAELKTYLERGGIQCAGQVSNSRD